MPDQDNAEVEKVLQITLLDGEKMLWTGSAGKGIRFVLRDIFFIPFSILWFGGALIWELIVLIGAPFPIKIIFSLIGVPFVALGFYLLAGRFWYDMKRRSNTFYALTTKRVIIQSGVFKTAVETFNVDTLASMEISEKSDGSGTIKLDADNPRYAAWKAGYIARKTVWAIEYVEDVRSIYDLILRQKEILDKATLSKHLEDIALLNSIRSMEGK